MRAAILVVLLFSLGTAARADSALFPAIDSARVCLAIASEIPDGDCAPYDLVSTLNSVGQPDAGLILNVASEERMGGEDLDSGTRTARPASRAQRFCMPGHPELASAAGLFHSSLAPARVLSSDDGLGAVVIPTPSRSRLIKMLNLLNRARKRAVVFDFCYGLLERLHDFCGAGF
jgi:hypothetical protein